MSNIFKNIAVLFWLIFAVIPFTVASAAILETTQAVSLEATPILAKVDGKSQLSAKSINYSNQLPIEGVAIRLQSDVRPEVYFRFLDSSKTWSDWQTAKLFEEPFTNRWIAAYNDELADKSHRFEVKIEVPDSETVKLLEQGVFPVDTEVYPDKTLSKPTIFPTDIPKPKIVSRQEWGARPPNGSYTQMPYYTKLTIHHAAGYSAENIIEGKKQVKAIQELHMGAPRKWTDIAYHFLVDRAGNIYQGRPETVIGAHTFNNNTGNIGVCVLGCYDPPWEVKTGQSCHQQLTQESREAVVHLFAWLAEQYGYERYGYADILKGHQDYYDYERTSCPGDNIWNLLPQIRDEINTFIKLDGYPFDFASTDNYPNPFNGTTKIDYTLPVESDISITIYNLKGQEVAQLVNDFQSKGEYSVNWNGKNKNGELVYTGIYFYQIRAHQKKSIELDEWYVQTGKMLYLK